MCQLRPHFGFRVSPRGKRKEKWKWFVLSLAYINMEPGNWNPELGTLKFNKLNKRDMLTMTKFRVLDFVVHFQ